MRKEEIWQAIKEITDIFSYGITHPFSEKQSKDDKIFILRGTKWSVYYNNDWKELYSAGILKYLVLKKGVFILNAARIREDDFFYLYDVKYKHKNYKTIMGILKENTEIIAFGDTKQEVKNNAVLKIGL